MEKKKELNKSPFETIKSEKINLGRFSVVQMKCVNGTRPYDYLEMMEGVSILPVPWRKYYYIERIDMRSDPSWQTELPAGG